LAYASEVGEAGKNNMPATARGFLWGLSIAYVIGDTFNKVMDER